MCQTTSIVEVAIEEAPAASTMEEVAATSIEEVPAASVAEEAAEQVGEERSCSWEPSLQIILLNQIIMYDCTYSGASRELQHPCLVHYEHSNLPMVATIIAAKIAAREY